MSVRRPRRRPLHTRAAAGTLLEWDTSVGAVETFGGEQKRAELASVHTVALARLNLRAPDVLSRVGGYAPVDVSEPVEATHRREASVNRRGGKPPLLHH